MNKGLMRLCGFGEAIDRVERGFCPFCGKPVTLESMSELEKREYRISGLCKGCQEVAFREEE